jgi:hypothetical protein
VKFLHQILIILVHTPHPPPARCHRLWLASPLTALGPVPSPPFQYKWTTTHMYWILHWCWEQQVPSERLLSTQQYTLCRDPEDYSVTSQFRDHLKLHCRNTVETRNKNCHHIIIFFLLCSLQETHETNAYKAGHVCLSAAWYSSRTGRRISTKFSSDVMPLAYTSKSYFSISYNWLYQHGGQISEVGSILKHLEKAIQLCTVKDFRKIEYKTLVQ